MLEFSFAVKCVGQTTFHFFICRRKSRYVKNTRRESSLATQNKLESWCRPSCGPMTDHEIPLLYKHESSTVY